MGYIYDDPRHPPGTRVITEAIRYIDPINFTAESIHDRYKLGEPGTLEEHNQPMIKKRPSVDQVQLETRMFLNPNG